MSNNQALLPKWLFDWQGQVGRQAGDNIIKWSCGCWNRVNQNAGMHYCLQHLNQCHGSFSLENWMIIFDGWIRRGYFGCGVGDKINEWHC